MMAAHNLAYNQLHTQSSPGERNSKFSNNGKFGQNGKFSQNSKHLDLNVSTSTHNSGCLVNGGGTMVAI